MLSDLRAQSIVQLRRPAHRVLLAAAAALTTTFGYLIPYAGYRGGSAPVGKTLDTMLPGAFAGTAVGGLPVFTGALALIFGVLVAGGDYAWETWKTLLVQQPSRAAVFAAKAGTIAVGTLILVLTLFAVSVSASLVIAGAENASTALPPLRDVLADAGAGWLIAFMWAMSGVLLAVALRSVALPVGIGLVWMLAVQNLITSLAAPALDWVDVLQEWLPGPAAGSLVATLGGGQGTPGVAELASGTQSVVVLVAYLALFMIAAAALLNRRDLT